MLTAGQCQNSEDHSCPCSWLTTGVQFSVYESKEFLEIDIYIAEMTVLAG